MRLRESDRGIVCDDVGASEATPELVHEFIEKIVVHEPYRENGKRFQQVDIHYLGVGVITVPTPAELEADFQHLLSEKKP